MNCHRFEAIGWWQQSIQMFCDLAIASNATDASGQCWASILGECLLQLGRFEPGKKWEDIYPETVDTLEIDTLKTILFFLGCFFVFPWAFAASFSDV